MRKRQNISLANSKEALNNLFWFSVLFYLSVCIIVWFIVFLDMCGAAPDPVARVERATRAVWAVCMYVLERLAPDPGGWRVLAPGRPGPPAASTGGRGLARPLVGAVTMR